MREHQIVINLKPDQFEEVQRMARAAGSKSVGLFVRQKLISTLGLAAPRTGAVEDDESPDLKQLTGELRRLHRELQIFVADSLSNSDYTMSSIEPIPFPTAVPENFLAEGAPLMPESVGYTYRAENNISIPFSEASGLGYANEGSESQFSTTQPQSPFLTEYPKPQLPGQFPPDTAAANLQPFNQQAQIQPTISQVRTSQTTDLQAPSAVPPVNAVPQSNPGIQPAYAIPPDANAASYAIPDPATMQPAYSVPEAPPETSTAPAQPVAPVSMPNEASTPVQSFAENDELEDLAERAFAISPRLGQLDEAVKRFPDPLKDLLEDALINGLDEEEEEVPESETEGSTEEQEETASDAPAEEITSDVENFETGEAEIAPAEESIDEEVSEYDSEPETQEETENEATDDDTPTDPPPPQPPPISGGPPPRKRRT